MYEIIPKPRKPFRPSFDRRPKSKTLKKWMRAIKKHFANMTPTKRKRIRRVFNNIRNKNQGND